MLTTSMNLYMSPRPGRRRITHTPAAPETATKARSLRRGGSGGIAPSKARAASGSTLPVTPHARATTVAPISKENATRLGPPVS